MNHSALQQLEAFQIAYLTADVAFNADLFQIHVPLVMGNVIFARRQLFRTFGTLEEATFIRRGNLRRFCDHHRRLSLCVGLLMNGETLPVGKLSSAYFAQMFSLELAPAGDQNIGIGFAEL